MPNQLPWLETPIIYDVRAKPRNIASLTGTKDLQMVSLLLPSHILPPLPSPICHLVRCRPPSPDAEWDVHDRTEVEGWEWRGVYSANKH